jgi:hypothetical protein
VNEALVWLGRVKPRPGRILSISEKVEGVNMAKRSKRQKGILSKLFDSAGDAGAKLGKGINKELKRL